MNITCPRCQEVEISIDVIRYDREIPAQTSGPSDSWHPGEPAEVEYEVGVPCGICGFITEDLWKLSDTELESIERELMAEAEKRIEADYDAWIEATRGDF